MAEWVHAAERAYIAAATGGEVPRGGPDALRARAHAAAGAIASHYLAVGSPRSLGLVVDVFGEVPMAAESLVAHRTWFAPKDVRCAATQSGADELAAATGGRVVTLQEAFAADIVCVHGADVRVSAALIRRGTHINVLTVPATIDDDLARIATVTDETPGLGELAAGIVDGRQLDEITVFVIGDAAIALAAVGP
jgi:hypothetical protein